MAAQIVEEFVKSPSLPLLDLMTKEHLLELAGVYDIPVPLIERRLKEKVRGVVLAGLVARQVLSLPPAESTDSPPLAQQVFSAGATPFSLVSAVGAGLSFEEQKALLGLQREAEIERLKILRESDALQREAELQRLKFLKDSDADRLRLEAVKLDIEQQRLDLIREGKLSGQSGPSDTASPATLNVAKNLRLVPHFNESDVDGFFDLFECVADAHAWSDLEKTLLLQSVLTGRAQRACSSLSGADRKDYAKVKTAVLKEYELVAEVYRHQFRTMRKGGPQSHTEFARDLALQFGRWRRAASAESLDALVDLMLLEQFKNTLPQNIATFIMERGVTKASQAAALADEWEVTHRLQTVAIRPRTNSVPSSANSVYDRRSPLSKNLARDWTCNYCGELGHWKADCPLLKAKRGGRQVIPARPTVLAIDVPPTPALEAPPSSVSMCAAGVAGSFRPFISEGFVSLANGGRKVPVNILRDTGASSSFILQSALPFSPDSYTGESLLIRGIGLNTLSAPLHRVHLDCSFVRGTVELAVRPALPVDVVSVILGNDLAGDKIFAEPVPPLVVGETPLSVGDECGARFPEVFPTCVVTRAASLKTGGADHSAQEKPFSLTNFPCPTTRDDLISAQRDDGTLKKLYALVSSDEDIRSKATGYFTRDDVLLRKWSPQNSHLVGDPITQVVVPEKLRKTVLQTAHDNLAGHAGVRKTYDRVLRYFFWPGIKRDVTAYVRTCKTCQLTGKPNVVLRPAPLRPIVPNCCPFEHLIIDCVGPLPRSKSGREYLLTVMCQATRYPAAYPLRSITSRAVVKALSQFISTFGLPRVIQSDRGSNFTSKFFAEILRQLGIQQNLSTAYHAQSQGALERFHSTLKSLLRAYCVELEGDWEEGLPWLLLAAREVTQESTGFSPNDLVFGHRVRGLLSVLHDEWTDSDPPKNLADYVLGFRRRLFSAWRLAGARLGESQIRMKKLFDRHTEHRVFAVGDRVLALLPIVGSPLQAKFAGPYKIIRCGQNDNYTLSTPERRKRTHRCHVNLLKPYYTRSQEECLSPVVLVDSSRATGPPLALLERVLMDSSPAGFPPLPAEAELEEEVKTVDDCVLQGRLKNSETLQNLSPLIDHLDRTQRQELRELFDEFMMLFSDVPTQTDVLQHDIDVGDAEPIRQRFYRVPLEKRGVLEKEVQYLLENGLAEPSFSGWSSPCLLVKKSDGSFRFCTDYRKLNAVTKPDSFPLPRIEDCVDQVGAAKFVTKLDLLKGYWQVRLTERAREVSAFITHNGLFAYRVMSFGLRNAPACFQRLMNIVVSGLEGVTVYLDDVVLVSANWPVHMERLRALFHRLAEARLTVNLAKCEFAGATVTYLGRVVGQGQVRPIRAKVTAIDNFSVPLTKRELMRFLGMVGFYRCFCRNFSSVVAPLTDLLKSTAAFSWTDHCQKAFDSVKGLLTSAPVLLAPRLEEPFKIQVDASNVGAGAVLLQEDESGMEHPVCFFSRKFLSYQLNYSVIEKEALALIWALQHFEVYVGGRGVPLVVYSDHNPLTFLHSLQNPNQRLMRWCLFLQPYHLDIRHIRGLENVVADALSRAPDDGE